MNDWKHTLEQDLLHLSVFPGGKDFYNEWLSIKNILSDDGTPLALLTIKAKYSCDGYSCVPDLKQLDPAFIHDAIYQFAEMIAAAWGWTVKNVLAWGDKLFLERMERDGVKKIIRKPYYWGVRKFGYVFHVALRWWRWIGDVK